MTQRRTTPARRTGARVRSRSRIALAAVLTTTLVLTGCTIGEGGAYVSNVRVTEQDAVLSDSDLLHGRWILLRRGRRHIGGIRVDGA